MTALLLARLRRTALALPGTSEVPSWGHPNFRVGKKTFAVYEIYRGRPCVAVKLPRPDGAVLLRDPRFFVTPYIGKQGWVSVWVDEPVPWALVKDLVLRSYREVAASESLVDEPSAKRARRERKPRPKPARVKRRSKRP